MKFSIVVPVYNVVHYLEKCLQSIFEQNYSDFEVILVDDGSTDGSGDLCDSYMEKDARVKVIHQRNQGLSAARNTGIAAAEGEYLVLVDSDDWLCDQHALQKISQIAITGTDVVMFDFLEHLEGKESRLHLTKDLGSSYSSGKLFLEEALSINPYYRWYACAYAYRLEFWKENEFQYPIGYSYEDLGTTYKVLLAANSVNVINEAYYGYRRARENSITSNVSLKSLEDKLELELNFVQDFLQEDISKELQDKAELNASIAYYELFIRANGIQKASERKLFLTKLQENQHLAERARFFNKKYRLSYRLLKILGARKLSWLFRIREKIKTF